MSEVIDLVDRRLPALQDLAARLERVEVGLKAFTGDAAAPTFRAAAEGVVEAIIVLLDALDGDPDLELEQEVRMHVRTDGSIAVEEYEDGDLEPSLGATEAVNQIKAWKRDWNGVPYDADLEEGDEREGDDLDRGESDGLDDGEADGLENGERDEEEGDHAPNPAYYRRLCERRQLGAALEHRGPSPDRIPVIFDRETGDPYGVVRVDIVATELVRR